MQLKGVKSNNFERLKKVGGTILNEWGSSLISKQLVLYEVIKRHNNFNVCY